MESALSVSEKAMFEHPPVVVRVVGNGATSPQFVSMFMLKWTVAFLKQSLDYITL